MSCRPRGDPAAEVAEAVKPRRSSRAAVGSMDRILILGAGFAGLTIATVLDGVAESGRAQVTLVDRNAGFSMGLGMEWVLVGRRTPDEGHRRYSTLRARHVRFLRDEIVKIDPQHRVVETRARRLEYDHLVIALGAELAPELVAGLAEGGHNLCDMASVERLQGEIERIEAGTVLVIVSSVPFKCPPAPYEYAFLIDDALRRRGVRDRVRVVVTTPEPQPMPVAGKAVGDAIKAMLSDRGIEYHPGRKPTSVDVDGHSVAYADGTSVGYDILAAMPPHRAPKVVREAGLTDASGFVPAKLGTFETEVSNVYAVGDVAALKLPSGNPHPKAGVFAEAQGLVVARGLAARLGVGSAQAYPGTGACFIDVGRDQAAPADVRLLDPSGPRVVLGPPSEAGLEEKRHFERERLEKWFAPRG